MKVNIFQSLEEYQAVLAEYDSQDVYATVKEILAEIQRNGDEALRKYTTQFDKVTLTHFKVPESVIIESVEALPARLREVLEEATSNIRKFHEKQIRQSELSFENDGTLLGWKVTPIDHVGIYIPGGRAVYPSSVLMNVIPAQVAGVPRITIVSPPQENGFPHPLVMATVGLLKETDLYAIGGAQSIGAMAYGTETIPAVNKITGPGNAFVTEAKKQVYGKVGIDSIAGPSDILILCDREDLPIEYLARDMLSQAEHDPQAKAILVTTSQTQANQVAQWIENNLSQLPRTEILQASFARFSAILVVPTLEKGIEITNDIAPEHLELLTKKEMEDLHQIRNAGAIFLGPYTPEPVGDYFAGPNHTLPTFGCAKFSSALGVHDFMKTSSVIRYSKQRLEKNAQAIIDFAKSEELFAHASSIQVRLETPFHE